VSRVDFYVLSDDTPDAKLRVACRLIEKAFDSGLRVYAQTASLPDCYCPKYFVHDPKE
jgi:DNA polymerase-3 subunit chi